jgi:hypothetical protein
MVYLLYIVIPSWCIVIYGIFAMTIHHGGITIHHGGITIHHGGITIYNINDNTPMFRAKVILDEFIIVSRFL